MTNKNDFLYDITLGNVNVYSEGFEIQSMSSLEVAAALHSTGLNAAHIVDEVRTTTDAMRKNAMIAKRMNIERTNVRWRAILLSIMTLVGLGAMSFAFIGAYIAPDSISEAARKLFILIFVGGVGLFLLSLLANLYVLWNAYIHKAILAEVASEETDNLVSAIQQIGALEPTATVTQLVIELEQNPIWERHRNEQVA